MRARSCHGSRSCAQVLEFLLVLEVAAACPADPEPLVCLGDGDERVDLVLAVDRTMNIDDGSSLPVYFPFGSTSVVTDLDVYVGGVDEEGITELHMRLEDDDGYVFADTHYFVEGTGACQADGRVLFLNLQLPLAPTILDPADVEGEEATLTVQVIGQDPFVSQREVVLATL